MRFSRPVTLLMIVLPMYTATAGQTDWLERLRADHAALVSAENDLHRQLKNGGLGVAEVTDYQRFIARLRERVARDCGQLALMDIQPPADLPCPANVSLPMIPVFIDQDNEQTIAERTATMEGELNSELGEFDELLLREQERVRASAPRSEAGSVASGQGEGDGRGEAGSGETASGETGSGEAGSDADRGQTGERVERGDSAGTGDQPPTGAGGPGTQTAAKSQPADIPDGSDDDVVARQLREAAEKETDPELKKKLWEEYRKYKRGTR